MDRQPGKPSGLCSPDTWRILIPLKIRAFRYSFHRTTKIRRLAFKFACEQSENNERSRIKEVSGQNSFLDENEAPKHSEVIVTLLTTKAGWLLHQQALDWQVFNNKGLPWILFQTMPLKWLLVIRHSYLFKGQAFQLGQILNLSLWPHVLWNKQRETYGSSRRKVSSKLLYRG